MSIEKLGQVWPEWKVDSIIGEGSFGKVYRAVREEHGMTAYSAIKVISIPQTDAELTSLRAEGWGEGATITYFQGIVNDFVNEIKMMESMKGTPNIVSVEDYKVLEKTDKVGWDIFIRMELLTSFNDYLKDRKLVEGEVIKLGEDILGALDLCSQRNIIHRDIKPENVFISSFGYFKLGDFGIARELGKTSGSMSQKGTFNYIAPEVATGRHYDATVDTYSLGIMLYRLLNNNKLPFLDPNAQAVQYQDRKNAIDRRLSGEPLPAPVDASKPMAQVILKACAFNPRDRYQSHQEFRQALEAVKSGMPVPEFSPTVSLFDQSSTIPAGYAQVANNIPQNAPVPSSPVKKKKSKKPLVIIIIVLIVAILGTVGYFVLTNMVSTGNVDKVIEALQNQDYSGAISAFNDVIDAKNIGSLETRLSGRLDEIRAGFMNKEIEYNAAIMELDTIRKFKIINLSGKINSVEEYINNLNDSRIAFSIAGELLLSGDYAGAIEHYKLVSLDDENYTNALDGVTKAVAECKEHALSESAGYAATDSYFVAMAVLDTAMEVIGNDAELRRQRDLYENQGINSKISIADDMAAGGDYAGAISELVILQAQFPDNTNIGKALSNIEASHVNAIVQQANGLSAENDFKGALQALNDGLRKYPDNATINTAIADTKSKDASSVVAQADILSAENDFKGAMQALNEGLKQYPDNATIKNAIASTQAKEVDFVIAQADELLEQRKYDGAASLVNETLRRIPGNATLQKKLESINAARPVSLDSVPLIDSSRYEVISGVFTDSFGYTYDGAYQFNTYNDTYAVYNIDKRFSVFSGSIVASQETDSGASITIAIYVDDKLAYTRTGYTKTTGKIDFSVDVDGATKLTISTSRMGGYSNYVYIVDAELIK